MSTEQQALRDLVAREEIRELVLLYSRGVDRKDIALLRTLYTKDGTDHHGSHFSGSAVDYIDFLERSMPHMRMSAHHVCNHLVSVDGDAGEGEVYAIAVHVIPDGKGGFVEDLQCVRYVDRYRREDGRWRFAARVVTFDHRSTRPIPMPDSPAPAPLEDPSYTTLSHRLFARGARA